MSFLIAEAERITKDNQLLKVSKIIYWERIEKIVGRLDRSGYGPYWLRSDQHGKGDNTTGLAQFKQYCQSSLYNHRKSEISDDY